MTQDSKITLVSILFGESAEDFRQQSKIDLAPEALAVMMEELGPDYAHEARDALVNKILPKDGTWRREAARAAAIFGII